MLALLSLLAITAMVTVAVAAVVAGQKQTRFDDDFENALQVAETGLDQMEALVLANPTATTAPAPVTGSGSDGSSWTSSAVKSGQDWTVTSTGTAPDGSTRRVRSFVTSKSLFSLAAFGKFFTDFNGGNGADSYNSANTPYGSDICDAAGSDTSYVANPDASNASDVKMCNRTGKGTIATNGTMKLKGQVAANTDRAEIHFASEVIPDPLPGATGVCAGVPALCGQQTLAAAKDCNAPSTSGSILRYCRDPIVLPPAADFCNKVAPAPTSAFNGTGNFGGGIFSFTDVALTGTTTFSGTMANPTIICMNGKLSIPNSALVNFEVGPRGTKVPRPAGSLKIFNTYSGSGAGMDFGNHASLSAAVYAPDASFQGGSQGNVYGSLIASSIDNNGGWNFHYDEALALDLTAAPVAATNWVEIPG